MRNRQMKELLQGVRGKKTVVVGAGVSGVAAARLLDRKGAYVRLLDRQGKGFEELRQEPVSQDWDLRSGEHHTGDFADAELVVLSPGIPRAVLALIPSGVPITSELELAAAFVREPVIAVTGTNGKTTTVSMISHILGRCGKKVFTGGNIGLPLSEYILAGQKCDILVLELSSFQLQYLAFFQPQVAILLNFSPNHLDYHQDLEQYFQAKINLFRYMDKSGLALFSQELQQEVASLPLPECKKVYYGKMYSGLNGVLSAEHNRANAQAASLAVEFFGITEKQVRAALSTFVPAAHRYEKFLEVGGICFINDSKATTLTALEAALNSTPAPVRLLVGGKFKGGDPCALRELIQSKVARVYLFGDSREIFEAAWQRICPLSWYPELAGAVEAACSDAACGDSVLLSPATASFDLFSDYQERGETFKRLVKEKMAEARQES